MLQQNLAIRAGHIAILVALLVPHANADEQSPAARADVTKLETLDERSALRAETYKAPCFSAHVADPVPVAISKKEVANRAEIRLRSAGIIPVPFEKCNLPDDRDGATVATRQQMKAIWLSLEPFFRDDGTFGVEMRVFRMVKWQVAEPGAGEDGFRGRLMSVDRYSEPSMPAPFKPRLRHEGRAVPVLEAIDRLMDEFLVEYLRQNQR